MNRVTGMLVVAVAVSISACRGTESPAKDATPGRSGQFDISLDTGGPLKMTAAPLNVTVHEGGKPVTDADVSVELRMPPSGAMGEMRTGAELKPAGDGHYRGQVDMMMAGQWNATVRVKRGGQVVATYTQPVTAAQ